MKKIWLLLWLLLFFVPVSYSANAETIKQDLLAMQSSNLMSSLGDGADLCLIVQTDAITKSTFHVKKTNSVSIKEEQCASSSFPGMIIKFHSYEGFKRFQEDPKKVIIAGFGVDYTLHQSSILEQGGILKCTDAFKKTYCDALAQTVGEGKLGLLKADCCMKGYQAAIQTVIGSSMFIWYVLIGIIIAVSLLGLLVTIRKEKTPEINQTILSYIKTTRQQGYDEGQIKTLLLRAGWSEKDIDVTMKKSKEV